MANKEGPGEPVEWLRPFPKPWFSCKACVHYGLKRGFLSFPKSLLFTPRVRWRTGAVLKRRVVSLNLYLGRRGDWEGGPAFTQASPWHCPRLARPPRPASSLHRDPRDLVPGPAL